MRKLSHAVKTWVSCEARGKDHDLAALPVLTTNGAQYRRCRRCPVTIREVLPRRT